MALLFAKNTSLSAVTELPASVSGGGLNLISIKPHQIQLQYLLPQDWIYL